MAISPTRTQPVDVKRKPRRGFIAARSAYPAFARPCPHGKRRFAQHVNGCGPEAATWIF
jgi:hypothetical protein